VDVHVGWAHDTHVSLSILTAIFPGEPGLTSTRMSPFRIFLARRMMKVAVTAGAIRRAKLQSNHHHQQTNTQLFTSQFPFLSPNQQCQSMFSVNITVAVNAVLAVDRTEYW